MKAKRLLVVLPFLLLGASQVPFLGATLTATNLVSNPSFETGISPWYFNVNNGSGTAVQDCSTAQAGSCSAKTTVSTSLGNIWDLSLTQGGLSLTSGITYTLSFSAKTSSTHQVAIDVERNYSPWTPYYTQQYSLTADGAWHQYSTTFTMNRSEANALLVLAEGAQTGTVWFDNVTASPPAAIPTPTPTASSTSISNAPCTVTLNGVQRTGTCNGTFTPNQLPSPSPTATVTPIPSPSAGPTPTPAPTPGPTSGTTTVNVAATNVPYYAPFQSHNHRMVYASGAIFMSYFADWDGGMSPGNGNVIVAKSTDNGTTWTKLLSIPIHEHAPASLETDSAGNVYAFMLSQAWTTSPADGWEWDARMYMLPKASNYLCGSTCSGNYLQIPKVDSDLKFATTYVPANNHLLIQGPLWQYTITASSSTTAGADPMTGVQNVTNDSNATYGRSTLEYPTFYTARDGSGIVLLAWTETNFASSFAYQDTYFIVSPDGAKTWYGKSGQISSWPIQSGADGAGWLINPSSETNPQDGPWLENAYVQDNHLLFMYSNRSRSASTPEYAEFNWSPTGHSASIASRITGSTTCIGNGTLCPNNGGAGGFFSGTGAPGAPIFFSTGVVCGSVGNNVLTLKSADSGATWHDFSSAGPNSNWGCEYAISGSPAFGPGGEIMGVFDNTTGAVSTNTTTLYFFKVT